MVVFFVLTFAIPFYIAFFIYSSPHFLPFCTHNFNTCKPLSRFAGVVYFTIDFISTSLISLLSGSYYNILSKSYIPESLSLAALDFNFCSIGYYFSSTGACYPSGNYDMLKFPLPIGFSSNYAPN